MTGDDLSGSRRRRLLAALAAVCIASCAWGPREELLGRWRAADAEVVEFMKDGTFLQSDEGGPLIGGRYRRVSDDTIRVSFGGPASYAPPRDYRVVRRDDALEITDPDGKTRSYGRID